MGDSQPIPIEISPRVWRWTARHPEWHGQHEWTHEVASFALASESTLVLVDPLLSADADAAEATVESASTRRISQVAGTTVRYGSTPNPTTIQATTQRAISAPEAS